MATMAFGLARRVITPRVPVSLAGYFTLRPWTHVLDDLLVQALAVRGAAGNLAVLVQIDLVSTSPEFTGGVRAGCADIAGLRAEDILFSASHTHTAPELRGGRAGANPDYTRWAIERSIEAVHEAVAEMRPGSLAYGCARDDRFAFNRRYWMADGTVMTNPPRRDPRIKGPEGLTDPEIPLLAFCVDGQPRVLLANIANHPDTITGCGVSADWHGFVRRRLESSRPGLQVVTLTGCAGNLNHFDPHGPDEQSGYDAARRIGEGYAASVLPVLDQLRPLAGDDLRTAAAVLTVGPREIDEEALAEARDHAARFSFDTSKQLTSEDLAQRSPAALKYFADALLALAADRRDRHFEIHALRLGPAVLVSLPGEPFTEHGLYIRKELLAGVPALVASLGDGRAVYIPNRENYGRGGYETMPRSSPYSMATGEILRSGVRDLLAGIM